MRDAKDTTERVAFISLGGVFLAAIAGAAGAGLGSWIAAGATRAAATIAAEQAEADRQAAHRALLADRLMAIASDALVGAERRRGEFWKQREGRNAVVAGKDRPESIPTVGDLDEVLAAVGQLYIVARQDTADAAWKMYLSLRAGLLRHVYDAAQDRQGDVVRPLTPDEQTATNTAELNYQRKKTAFLNLVRVELGLSPLEEGGVPFPPEIAPVITSVTHISGSSYTTPPGGVPPESEFEP